MGTRTSLHVSLMGNEGALRRIAEAASQLPFLQGRLDLAPQAAAPRAPGQRLQHRDLLRGQVTLNTVNLLCGTCCVPEQGPGPCHPFASRITEASPGRSCSGGLAVALSGKLRISALPVPLLQILDPEVHGAVGENCPPPGTALDPEQRWEWGSL